MSAKNPRNPPGPLAIKQSDIFTFGMNLPLFRIHTVHGQHPMPWNGLREIGPLPRMRWDPHPLPLDFHPGIGVAYCATDPTKAFAEVFQFRRTIRINTDQALSAWLPSRELRLLDLTGLWATQNGASASLHSAPQADMPSVGEDHPRLQHRTTAQWGLHTVDDEVGADGCPVLLGALRVTCSAPFF